MKTNTKLQLFLLAMIADSFVSARAETGEVSTELQPFGFPGGSSVEVL